MQHGSFSLASPPPLRVLIIEDSPGDRLLLLEALSETSATIECINVENLADGLQQLAKERFDVILLDLGLPDSNGLASLFTVLEHSEATPVIVLTGLSDKKVAQEAVEAGAQDYLSKNDLHPELLERCIYYSIARKRAENKLTLALELQTAVSTINGIRGMALPLAKKLEGALNAILSIRWGSASQQPKAAISTHLPNKKILICEAGLALTPSRAEALLSRFEHEAGERIGTTSWLENTEKNLQVCSFTLAGQQAQCVFILDCSCNTSCVHRRYVHEFSSLLEQIEGLVEGHLHFERIAQLSRAVEQSPSGIVITTTDGTITYANKAVEDVTGYPVAELIGETPAIFRSGETAPESYRQLWDTILRGEVWRGEIRNKRKDGVHYWESQVIAPVIDSNGDPVNFIAFKENIEFRKRSEQELLRMATHDGLTGLPNRLLIMDRLEQALNQAHRYEGSTALVLIDLDQFKLVNDQQGHLMGDLILKDVALRMQSLLRETDTVGRQGGDEFILILPQDHQKTKVDQLLKRYLDALSQPYSVGDYTIHLSCSMGVSFSNGTEFCSEELLRRADVAMYHSKSKGGNCSSIFDPQFDDTLNQRVWFRGAIKEALEQQQFVLYYQPQICNQTGNLTGAEALIRWSHPTKGMIQPLDFIPIAEETGDIIGIGDWVFREACRQLRAWEDQNFPLPRLAINVTAQQLNDKDLLSRIRGYMDEFSITSSCLEVEVTESEIMRSPERAIDNLMQLRQLGLHISGDDFGTGYSSLSYLKQLPLNKLKIDRSFVIDIVHNNNSQAIAAMIINLGHTLGLEVLAEGIEQHDQLRLLTRMGCDQFQGFLCSKPLPAQQLLELCQNQQALVTVASKARKQRTLLLVDDEPFVLKALKRELFSSSYNVLTASTKKEAFSHLASHDIGVVISDQRMPEMSGTEFLSQVKRMYPDTVRMVLSGYTNLETIITAINEGAIFKFLAKPWDEQQLKSNIEEAFQFHELKRKQSR